MTNCPLTKPSEFSSGAFFKPSEHLTDLALLIEPKAVDRDVQNTYQGRTTRRDEVTCDITIFATAESLETGVPSAFLADIRIVHGMLTSTLEKIIGGALVGVIRKIPTRSGTGYVLRDAEPDAENAVIGYHQWRERGFQDPAPAAGSASTAGQMPSFDG